MKKIYFLLLSLCLFTSLNAQIVTIPDAIFKAKLLAASSSNGIAKNLVGNYFKIDANNNGEIEVSEALQVKELYVNNSLITSLVGISSFTNLQNLKCQFNQLTSLNLSGLTNLYTLWCYVNQLTSLNVSGLTSIQSLDCSENQLTSLNVSGLTSLQSLDCSDNQLTSLNVIGLTSLQNLDCSFNQLTSLNGSGLISLQILSCPFNQLTSINVNGLTNLHSLVCSFNQLTSLNGSGLTSIQSLSFDNNPLTSLFIKNGINEPFLYFEENPGLLYICADDSQLSTIQTQLNTLGYTNCVLNSYCSFVPGGTFYTIQGNTKYDSDNNGCSASDFGTSNFKFNITDGTTTGSLISNTTGAYSIPVQSGTHVLTPVLENPTYFTVSPTTVSVTFPTQTSPFNQNFCLTPNGSHPDLEVTLLPVNAARPGFDTHYKIIYKNKGTNMQSGTVNLTFNDAVLDLVTANPVASSQTTNNLSWAFTNLVPFEIREIAFTLNVNTPLETPAVNGGDILNYTTAITSTGTDDTPLDNTFALNQTVVNSFDPNDKTCLEGATITTSMVGNCVHYMIRFENTGTYPAENIVVKDMIDATKFDVSTLVPTSGSHPFVTRITETNKVEFIFENINLPFDDANNDGYVAFKIKTKPTLVVGNTFSNTASIYFDYNSPIVTNTANTTVAVLGTQDFEFSTYFSLYPNPTVDILNIDLKKEIEVSSINIYNTLGQLVLVIPNAQEVKTVDVSGLTTGNYLVKLNTDKGMGTSKFVKK
jgi:Leucine-rich repeat (LRR) protein